MRRFASSSIAVHARQWVTALARRSETAQHRPDEHLLQYAEDLAQLGCATTDLISDEIRWSQGMYRLFDEPASLKPTADWLYHRVPQNERDFVRSISQGVTAEAPAEFQHRILRADGKLRTVMHRCMVELDDSGFPYRQIVFLQDVTQQRDAEQRIDRLANSDATTGLPNRNALLEHLEITVREAQRAEHNIGLLVLQIDQLDIVAHSLGLEWGDQLLAQVAERLRLALGGRGLLAHLGSGEFAAVLTGSGGDVDEARARSEAESLRRALAAPVMLGDTEVQLGSAAGLTIAPRDGEQPHRLLQQAQAALGRAEALPAEPRVCLFDAQAQERMAARLAMEASLRHALKRNEFTLRFQPQLDLHTGQIIGAEALLRWFDPKRQAWVPPVEFIPLAEETGQIVEIGEWVLRHACRQQVAWMGEGLRPIRVSVNLSVRQLQQADIAQRIQAILLETGLDPQHLALEITESILVDESTHVAKVLRTLGALGIEIALDDFGTGYSNLNYLRALPIKVLKIDRSIVHDVTAAEHDVSMTRAVINMAHGLQLKVLAEGVESEGQLSLLMANRCDQMQGYYFSAAVSPEELAQMLRDGLRLPEHLYQDRQRERTLLLVDDEENIVAALKRLLRRDGYRIITASSGAQGLQKLVEQPVDVIVSDQRMPGMTGVEFLRRAKELYPQTVRIVLSGYTELQSITDAVNEGAIYKFLTKPWDDERLRGHIAEAFRNKEMADENERLAGAVSKANEELAAVNKRLGQLALHQSRRLTQEETSLQVIRQVLEHIPAAVIGIDPEGIVAYVNAEAERLLEPGLISLPAEQCLPPALLQAWRLEEAGEDGPWRVELQGRAFQLATRTMEHGRLLVLSALLETPLRSAMDNEERRREPVEPHH
ncbi:EAL domain-containing protein [Pelomonas sp. KK5]|uniref:EAL domain-containing protein n=1 Tax=Pelomonas sp. KK5 TaxID=1855730 RepID=UPI00097C9D40|nr:EAL domain-containing protein [Pelomonas sp. KK5]